MARSYRHYVYVIALAALLLSTFGFAARVARNASAQDRQCPEISCSKSTYALPIGFRVFGGSSLTRYGWSVSTGSIIGADNLSRIRVGGIPKGPCEGTVTLSGIPRGCPSQLSCTTNVVCPDVTARGPKTVDAGDSFTITVRVGNESDGRLRRFPERDDMKSAHAQDDGLTYNWSISAGTISKGQGTPSITIDTESLPAGSRITMTVEIGGVVGGCTTTHSWEITLS
jgi:hypothetical protein